MALVPAREYVVSLVRVSDTKTSGDAPIHKPLPGIYVRETKAPSYLSHSLSNRDKGSNDLGLVTAKTLAATTFLKLPD